MGAFSGAITAFTEVDKFDFLVAATKQDNLSEGFREILKRCFHVSLIVCSQTLDHLEVVGRSPVPATDRTTRETKFIIGDYPCLIKKLLYSQTIAIRAGTMWAVK